MWKMMNWMECLEATRKRWRGVVSNFMAASHKNDDKRAGGRGIGIFNYELEKVCLMFFVKRCINEPLTSSMSDLKIDRM